MSGRRDESLLLDDVVHATSRLIELGSQSEVPLGEDLSCDEQVQYNLIILGEAVKRLSPATRERFADVPWSPMARARDRVVHHYEGVDWAVIETIIGSDLPPMLPRLLEIRDIVREEYDAGQA
ncbi:MAG: HepT-like ribonuclease domain-containing protein [Coriobacteriia bacterium]|nr:HepT-like ribonuclease domain-containing protein [Coriobacteriia bacterium]